MDLPNRITRLRTARESLESQIGRSALVVVLLGSAGNGLEERRDLARTLNGRGMVALVPEDDFPRDVGPSVMERAVLSTADVDLVFVNVRSWGTATEFGQFHSLPRIARKLRILVDPDHHPIHGPTDGYLRDLYLTHLTAYGHVYAVNAGRMIPTPSAASVVRLLTERHRQIKSYQPNLIR